MDFFTDKFETSQDVKHSCAVAFCNLSHQLSWYDWFTEGSIGRKGTSCFVSFKNVFSNDRSDLVTRKVEVRTIWLADFNTKAVSIWVSCNQYISVYFAAKFFSKSKGSLVFRVWRFNSWEVSIWNGLSLNNLNSFKSSLGKSTTSQHFTSTMKWCVDNLHVATVFIDQVLVDVNAFHFFQVFSVDVFTDNFNQATSFAFFKVSQLYSERIFDSTDVICQSIGICRWHLSTVFTIYLISIKRSRVVASGYHNPSKCVEMTNSKWQFRCWT